MLAGIAFWHPMASQLAPAPPTQDGEGVGGGFPRHPSQVPSEPVLFDIFSDKDSLPDDCLLRRRARSGKPRPSRRRRMRLKRVMCSSDDSTTQASIDDDVPSDLVSPLESPGSGKLDGDWHHAAAHAGTMLGVAPTCNVLPANVLPANVLPANVLPANVLPATTEDVLPEDVLPATTVLPDDVLPANVLPANVLPEDVLPANVLPANVLPEYVLPANVLPANVLPANEDVLPEDVLPDDVLLANGLPANVLPEDVLPAKVLPDVHFDLGSTLVAPPGSGKLDGDRHQTAAHAGAMLGVEPTSDNSSVQNTHLFASIDELALAIERFGKDCSKQTTDARACLARDLRSSSPGSGKLDGDRHQTAAHAGALLGVDPTYVNSFVQNTHRFTSMDELALVIGRLEMDCSLQNTPLATGQLGIVSSMQNTDAKDRCDLD
jgi:hypothetical protein